MRAYMHGYFVDNRLWHKARALAEPFAYDTYRQQRVQQKMEQERKSRIGIVKKLPKVRIQMLYLHIHMHCSLCICIVYMYRHMLYIVAQWSYGIRIPNVCRTVLGIYYVSLPYKVIYRCII